MGINKCLRAAIFSTQYCSFFIIITGQPLLRVTLHNSQLVTQSALMNSIPRKLEMHYVLCISACMHLIGSDIRVYT